METILVLLLLFSPLVGSIANLFGRKFLKNSVTGVVASTSVLVSFIISCILFIRVITTGEVASIHLFDWILFGDFSAGLDFTLDQLSLLWLVFVTGIGFLIHVYSIGYMKGEENIHRYFAYLNLFVFFMQILVSGSNLLVMFIGWEGVGLCSYLLIGFWYKDHKNNNAAKKAFIMNRIGDLFFLIGVMILIYLFNTVDFISLKYALSMPSYSTIDTPFLIGLAALCLFIGATGKSAQIPLYTWLPDAMAGPTPVSALIHAATMVTAGIFMITRLNFLFDLAPQVLQIIAVVGAITALFAASIAVFQNDIKKVLAYSTVSQLGLMFLAIGCGAYHIAVFHVITHAFFKACLFLGAGSVIHAMGGEQDMRKMGGLKPHLKITYITFLLATCSISGLPLFAGFFSKDEIMLAAFEHNKVLWIMAALASLMTAFYMFRALYLTFFKSFRGTNDQKAHLHESPKSMTMPLVILGIFSVIAGFIGLPIGYNFLNNYLQPIIPNLAVSEHHFGSTAILLMVVSTVIALTGLGLAYYKYIKQSVVPGEDKTLTGFAKLAYNKYYIDEIYNALFVKPIHALGAFFENFAEKGISYFVSLFCAVPQLLSIPVKRLQNGSLGLYLFFFVLGFCSIIVFLFIV